MAKQSLIIDLTSAQIISYLRNVNDLSTRQPLDLKIPLNVVVALESGEVNILAGEPAGIYQVDENILVFDNVIKDLPEIEDEYAQEKLTEAFWSAVCLTASWRHTTSFDDETTGFIIYPQNYSARLLETMRSGCVRSEGIKNVAFINEAAALICGMLEENLLEIPNSAQIAGGSINVAAIVGQNKQNFQVVCFDYSQSAAQIPQFLIKDYFRTTAKHLAERLKKCEWKTYAAVSALLHPENFNDSDKKHIKRDLQNVFRFLRFEPNCAEVTNNLKSLGASQIAKYAVAEAGSSHEFEMTNATNIGIRLDQHNFYPVLQKNVFNAETKYPCFAAKSFEWLAETENEFTFSVHAGYSELVGEAALLGWLHVNAADLACLKGQNKSELVAVACLKTPGEGEFTLGLMPDNRIIGKLPFVLPGIVC